MKPYITQKETKVLLIGNAKKFHRQVNLTFQVDNIFRE